MPPLTCRFSNAWSLSVTTPLIVSDEIVIGSGPEFLMNRSATSLRISRLSLVALASASFFSRFSLSEVDSSDFFAAVSSAKVCRSKMADQSANSFAPTLLRSGPCRSQVMISSQVGFPPRSGR